MPTTRSLSRATVKPPILVGTFYVLLGEYSNRHVCFYLLVMIAITVTIGSPADGQERSRAWTRDPAGCEHRLKPGSGRAVGSGCWPRKATAATHGTPDKGRRPHFGLCTSRDIQGLPRLGPRELRNPAHLSGSASRRHAISDKLRTSTHGGLASRSPWWPSCDPEWGGPLL